MTRVLVIVHDSVHRGALVAALRGEWYLVDQAADGIGASTALSHRAPDAVVLDMDLPDDQGPACTTGCATPRRRGAAR